MVETKSFHDEHERLARGVNTVLKDKIIKGQNRKHNNKFPNGQMFIHLKRNKLSYFPGDKIEGSVLVQQ